MQFRVIEKSAASTLFIVVQYVLKLFYTFDDNNAKAFI